MAVMTGRRPDRLLVVREESIAGAWVGGFRGWFINLSSELWEAGASGLAFYPFSCLGDIREQAN